MALPKLLREIFENDGSGPKFRADKVPVDGALSATSENPVQNKVINSALDGKLSLSGGTMTGEIAFNKTTGFIGKADNNGYLALSGGNNISIGAAGSAILWLCGGDASSPINRPGEFSLEASKGTYGQPGFSSYEFRGKPDGSLLWGENNVISVVAESYVYHSYWYRKYSDGWIEQGGEVYFSENETNLVITLPIAFFNPGYTVTFSVGAPLSVWLTSRNTTNFSVNSNNSGGDVLWWYACGK